MTAAEKLNLVSVGEYLAGELDSPVKHEYLGGVVYAMAGARNAHNIVATNITVLLGVALKGQRCRPYNSDTKVRVRLPTHERFYYPDVSVICEPNPQEDSFQDRPVVIFEVLSKKTKRIDGGEKKDAYLTIPTLNVYAMVEQELARVILFRRTEQGFVREVYDGLEAVLPLPEIKAQLRLAEVYESVAFMPELDDLDDKE